MDKAIKMSALQMGLLGKEGDEFNKTMIRSLVILTILVLLLRN
jgi:L-lactate permease